MKATLFSLLLLGTTCQAEVGLVIGGFGATDTVQVVTKDAVCLGSQSNPVIAKAPDGRFGWVAQYVDGQIVLCGGAKTDIYKDCFTFSIGSAWR